jgi:hypothetical protein
MSVISLVSGVLIFVAVSFKSFDFTFSLQNTRQEVPLTPQSLASLGNIFVYVRGFLFCILSMHLHLYQVWMGTTSAADIAITVCMFVLVRAYIALSLLCSTSPQLFKAREGSSTENTRDLLSELIKVTVETGFTTSVLAFISIPLFAQNLPEIAQIPYVVNF